MTDQPKNKKTPDKPAAPEQKAKAPEGTKETVKPPVDAGAPKDSPKAAAKPPEGAAEKAKPAADSKAAPDKEETKSGVTSADKNAVGAKVEPKPEAAAPEPSPTTAKTPDMAAAKPTAAPGAPASTTEKTAIGDSAPAAPAKPGSEAAPPAAESKTTDKPEAAPPASSESTSAAKPADAAASKADSSQVAPTKPGSEASPKPEAAPPAADAKPADAPSAPAAEAAAKPTEPPASQAAAPSSQQPASSMQRCPNCGHRNRPGVLICENCGTNLVTGKTSVAGTRDLLRDQEGSDTTASGTGPLRGTAPLVDTGEMRAVQAAGSHVFEDNMVLRIEIEGGTTPILVYPKQEIIFGRRDPTSGGMPDVDLTPYAGYRMGVSRRHAAIRLQDKRLDVSDLGSSNGTFLNGTRLSAHRPYQLRDGDEVRLGQMVMRVFFQTNTGRNK